MGTGLWKQLFVLASCVWHSACLKGFGAIWDVSPYQGSTAGGTELHLAGTGFADVVQVLIDGRECQIFKPSVKDGEMFCYTPASDSNNIRTALTEVVWSSGFKATYKGRQFSYSPYLTPSVHYIPTPSVGVLDNITFKGDIKEQLMGGQDFTLELLGEKRNATRVIHAYLGSGLHVMSDKGGDGEYRCDIIDTPGTIADTGICEVKASMPAGYYNFTYVVSKKLEFSEIPVGFGRDWRLDNAANKVSPEGKLFDVEVFPTIKNITGTPKVGVLGGSALTIKADGLDPLFRSNSEHKVMIAGVPCEVTNTYQFDNDDYLQCTTGPVSSREQFYPTTQATTWDTQSSPVIGFAPSLYDFPEKRKRTFNMTENIELYWPLIRCGTNSHLDPIPQYSLEHCAEICFRLGTCKMFYHEPYAGKCFLCGALDGNGEPTTWAGNIEMSSRRRGATWEPSYRSGGTYRLKMSGREYLEAHPEGPNWKLVSSHQECEGSRQILTSSLAKVGYHGADVQTCADQCAMSYIATSTQTPCKYFGLYRERVNPNSRELDDANKVRCVIYLSSECTLRNTKASYYNGDVMSVFEITKYVPSFPQATGFYPGGRGVFYRVWNACPDGAIYRESPCWPSWWEPSQFPFGALYATANPEYAAQTPMFEGVRADALMGPFGSPQAKEYLLDTMEAYDASVPFPTLADAAGSHGLIYELFAFFVPPFTATYSFFTWGVNHQDLWLASSPDQSAMDQVAMSLIGQSCSAGGKYMSCSIFYESTNGALMKDSYGFSGSDTPLKTPSLKAMPLQQGEKRFLVKRVYVPPNTLGWGNAKPTDFEGTGMRLHKPDLSSLSADAQASLKQYKSWPEMVRFTKSVSGSVQGFFRIIVTIDGVRKTSTTIHNVMSGADIKAAFASVGCKTEYWATGGSSASGSKMFVIWEPAGDIPDIEIDASGISGSASYTVDTISDGDENDLFIFPIMGTHLEVPMTVPQATLSTMGLTARNGNYETNSAIRDAAGKMVAAAPFVFDYAGYNYDATHMPPTCTVAPAVAYRYFKLSVTKNAGDNWKESYTHMTEVFMWGPGADGKAAPIDLTSATLTSSIGASGGYPLASLNDGDLNTDFRGDGKTASGTPAEFTWDLGDGNAATPLMWTYAGGRQGVGKDPRMWILQGSTDGSTWTDLKVQDWLWDRFEPARGTVLWAQPTDITATCAQAGVGMKCGWGYTFSGTVTTGLTGDLDAPRTLDTWEACQQHCCYDWKCLSVTWDQDSKICQKFARAFEVTYSQSATGLVANKLSHGTPDDGYEMTPREVADPGEALTTYTGHQTVNYCKKMCNANPECHSFSWEDSDGCILRKQCVTSATQLAADIDRTYRNIRTFYQVHPAGCAPAPSPSYPTTQSTLRFPSSAEGTSPFKFEYLSESESPSVTELLVNGAASTSISEGDAVVLKGNNFDLQGGTGEVTVKIGSFKCPITSVSATEISCTAGANTHKRLNLKVMVGWKGWANFGPLVKPQDGLPRAQIGILFGGGVAVVTEIKPAQGSMLGGTRLTIKGKGFDVVSDLNTVLIGTGNCLMRAVSVTEIQCVTPDQSFIATTPVAVSVNSVSTLGDGSSITYTYDESFTPTVASLSPAAISYAVTTQVQLLGTKFGFNPGFVTVTFGGRPCRTLSVADSSISCQLTRTMVTDPTSALAKPTVMIAGVGYAQVANTAVLDTTFAIHSVSPSVGSYEGGCTITITGIGFSSAAVTQQRFVAVLGTFADVISWSPTQIVATTRQAVQNNNEVEVSVNLIKAWHLCGPGHTAGLCSHDVFGAQEYTPIVTSFSPTEARAGEKLTAVITMPPNYIGNLAAGHVTMHLGDHICPLDGTFDKAGNSLTVACTVPEIEASAVQADILIEPLGFSKFNVPGTFTSKLVIDSITPNQGSLAGTDVVLSGAGFSTSAMKHFVRVGGEYGICEPTSSSYSQLACKINYHHFTPESVTSPDAEKMIMRPHQHYCSLRQEGILQHFTPPAQDDAGFRAARDACNEFCIQEVTCNACSIVAIRQGAAVVVEWRALAECKESVQIGSGKITGDCSVKARPKEVSQGYTRYPAGIVCVDRTSGMARFDAATNSHVDLEGARDLCEEWCLSRSDCWGCTIKPCYFGSCHFIAIPKCDETYYSALEDSIVGTLSERTVDKVADIALTLWTSDVSTAPLTAFAGRMIGCLQGGDTWITGPCVSQEACALRCLSQDGCESFEFTPRYQKCVLSRHSFTNCPSCLEGGQDDCIYYEKKSASAVTLPSAFTYKYDLTPKIAEVWTAAPVAGTVVAGVQTTDTGCQDPQPGDAICCDRTDKKCSWGEGFSGFKKDSQCAGLLTSVSYACPSSPLQDSASLLDALADYDAARDSPFMGCYKDAWQRDMGVNKGSPGGFVNCAEACSDYLYFGRQSSDNCWCSDEYGDKGLGDANQCSLCSKTSNSLGAWANCVYANNYAEPWESISATAACGGAALETMTGTRHECMTKCADTVACQAVDYFSTTSQCKLLAEACINPTETADGASSERIRMNRFSKREPHTLACGGTAIESLTGSTLDACQQKCLDTPTCTRIDFFSATGLCTTHETTCDHPGESGDGAQTYQLGSWVRTWLNVEIKKAAAQPKAPDSCCVAQGKNNGFEAQDVSNKGDKVVVRMPAPNQVEYEEGTITEAEYNFPGFVQYTSEPEVQSACSADPACLGYWKGYNREQKWCILKAGSRVWKLGTPNEYVLSVKKKVEGDITVSFGGVPCTVDSKAQGQGLVDVTCVLGEVPGGLKHYPVVQLAGAGKGFDAYNWVSVPLTLDAVSAVNLAAGSRSLGGGWILHITGNGFAPASGADTTVEATICGRKCVVTESTYTELKCTVPKVYTPELYSSGTDFGLQVPVTRVISNFASLPDSEAPQCFAGKSIEDFMMGTSECMSVFDSETEVLGGVSGSGCHVGLDFGEFTSVRIEQFRFFPPFNTQAAANYIGGKFQIGELDAVKHAECDELTYGWRGVDYKGCQTQTVTDAFCERWDVAMPDLIATHPELAGHSKCRNPAPTSFGQIWCVTKKGYKQTCNRKPPPVVWTTVHTIKKQPKMLWNSHVLQTPLVTRFVRFQNPSGDCRFNEAQVIGNLVAKEATCGVAVRNVMRMSGELVPLDLTRPGYGSFYAPYMTNWVTSTANPVTFAASVTPYISSIEPQNGTARGGTVVTLTGVQLDGGAPTITFNGYDCAINSQTSTMIQCTTSARNKGINPPSTVVHLAGVGNALLHPHVRYRYLDPWSEPTTWADEEPPFDGDMVIVPNGQAILVDMDTPILNILVVEGLLVFDDTRDIHLQAHYIWVKGGTFEIGNEQKPYLRKALVTLHGDKYNAIRLPIVGAKCLAVSNEHFTIRDFGDGAPEEGRTGYLDIHGAPRKTVWTSLTQTVEKGGTVLKVKNNVDFQAGETIIITSTDTPEKHFGGGNFGAPPVDFHDEEVIVSMVESDMRTIHLVAPVQHKHISTKFTRPDGEVVDLSAEVALLSRNVKIQGNEESERNSWGGHTLVAFGGVYRIENAEFYRMGQTAELSRYPIHFHVARDWGKLGYVKHNSIHNSFQRAVTIHATDYVLVQGNVGFKTRGHMFFVETGMEKYNVFDRNLAVGAVPLLSGLVESDMEPSGFWTATPNNFWRDNVAATGSDGWYFQLPGTPMFHSESVYGRSICPIGEHLGEANGNKCHHISGTCMRVYHIWKPLNDPCNPSSGPAPQILYNTTCWGNGFMCFNAMLGGALHNHHMTSIEVRNIDLWMEHHNPTTWSGIPTVKDSVFVGILPENVQWNSPQKWKASVIEMPQDENFFVESSQFINYFKVPVFQDCSGCYNNGKWKQGAYTYHFNQLSFHNSSKRIFIYKKGIYYDMDGSLVGQANSFTTWADPFNLDTSACVSQTPPVAAVLSGNNWRGVGTVHSSGCCADPSDSMFHIVPPTGGKYFHEVRGYKFITCNRPIRLFAIVEPNAEVALRQLNITNIDTGAKFIYEYEDKDQVGWTFPVLSNQRLEVQPNLLGLDLEESSLRYGDMDLFQLKENYALKQKREVPQEWFQLRIKSDSAWDHYNLHTPDAMQVGYWVSEQKIVKNVPGQMSPAPFNNAPDYSTLSSMTHGMLDGTNWAVNFRFPAGNAYDIPFSAHPNTARFQGDRCPELGCVVPITPTSVQSMNKVGWSSKFGAGATGDLEIAANEWVEFDVTGVVSIGTLTIRGKLSFVDGADRTLEASAIILYGHMRIGEEGAPFGATSGSKATIRLKGALGNNYLQIGENNIHGKSIAVIGDLAAYGAPLTKTWGHLEASINPGSQSACVRGVTDWPVGSEVWFSPTEFDDPNGHTEKRILTGVSQGSGCLNIQWSGGLSHPHAAGDVDVGNGKSVSLRAVVARTDRTVVIESKEYSNYYGGHIEVTDLADVPMAGQIVLKNVGLFHLGKGGLEAAVKIEYSVEVNPPPVNEFENCAWFNSLRYGIQAITGSSTLMIYNNVFVKSSDGGIWTELRARQVTIVDNAVIAIKASPKAASSSVASGGTRVANFAGIRVDYAQGRISGNVVAGSNDIGFLLPMEDCSGMTAFNNEAHATIVGAFLRDRNKGNCQAANLYTVWKAAHIAVYLADTMRPTRLRSITVSDSHEGIVPYFTIGSGYRRLWVTNTVLIGTSPLSSCSYSLKCRAQSESDPGMAGCNSIFAPTNFRRLGFLLPINSLNAKQCSLAQTQCRYLSPAYIKLGCQFPLEGTMYMDKGLGWANFTDTTFAYWKENDCNGMSTRAITMNPHAAEIQWPTSFTRTTWHESDDVAKFELSAEGLAGAWGSTAKPCQASGSGCMGLDQSMIQDIDGTLLNLNFTSYGSVLPLTTRTDGIFRPFCEMAMGTAEDPKAVDAMICGNLTTNLLEMTNLDVGARDMKYGPLVLTPDAEEENGFEGGTLSSGGPFYAQCPCGWDFSFYHILIKPSTTYYAEVMNFPGNFKLTYWSPSPAEAVVLEFFYPDSSGVNVFVGSQNDVDPRLNVNRAPTLADDHGTHMVDPQNSRFWITLRGSEQGFMGRRDIVVKKTPTVKLQANIEISLQEFSGPSFTMNLAILLGIPPERIKVVNVQTRRRLQAGQSDGISVGIEIAPSADAAAAAGTQSTSQDALDLETQELGLVSQTLLASMKLPTFAKAAGGRTSLESSEIPLSQDQGLMVETPETELLQPPAMDTEALAADRASAPVSATAPCPAQTFTVTLFGTPASATLASPLASGASSVMGCADVAPGYTGTLGLLCRAGTLLSDTTLCVPGGCAQSVQVTVGGTTVTQSLSGLSSGLSQTKNCEDVDSLYIGLYTISCNAGDTVVDTSGCAKGCGTDMALNVLVADKAASWSPSGYMKSGEYADQSCGGINSLYTGDMKVWCYFGVLTSDPAGCVPKPCDVGDSFDVALGPNNHIGTVTLDTAMASGDSATLDCGLANSEYSGDMSIRCQLGGVVWNAAACGQVCSTSMKLPITLGAVTTELSPTSRLDSGGEERFDCSAVDPNLANVFYLQCDDGQLSAQTDLCIGQACPTSMSAEVTVGVSTGTISPPARLSHGESFQALCTDIDAGSSGLIEGTCEYGTISVVKHCAEDECDWQCYMDRYVGLQNVCGPAKMPLACARNHWSTHGEREGRDCTCDFPGCDWQCYLDRYPDLAKNLNPPTLAVASMHYKNFGQNEGRDCSCEACLTSDQISVTLGAETVDVSPDAIIAHDTKGTTPCSGVNSEYNGDISLYCFKGSLSVNSTDGCVKEGTVVPTPAPTPAPEVCSADFTDAECQASCSTDRKAVLTFSGMEFMLSPPSRMKSGTTADVACPGGMMGLASITCENTVVTLDNMDGCSGTVSTTQGSGGGGTGCASQANGGPAYVAEVGTWSKVIYASRDLASGESELQSCTLFGADYQGNVKIGCSNGELSGDVGECMKIVVENSTVGAANCGLVAMISMFLVSGLLTTSWP